MKKEGNVMKKNTLAKASAIFAAAIMTASTVGMTISGAEKDAASKKSISLHDKEVYAGATVEIPLTMRTENQCTSYDLLVEYDSNLEFVSITGAKASESFEENGRKYISMTSFETSPYKDGAIAASIKLYVPPTVEYADYSISFDQISSFSSNIEDFEDYITEDATISVVPFVSQSKGSKSKARTVEKHSECMVFQKFGKDGKIIDASVGYRGDANGDGKANIKDATAIAAACAGRRINKVKEQDAFFGDVNEDGILNIKDAVMIAKFIAKGRSSWDDILK